MTLQILRNHILVELSYSLLPSGATPRFCLKATTYAPKSLIGCSRPFRKWMTSTNFSLMKNFPLRSIRQYIGKFNNAFVTKFWRPWKERKDAQPQDGAVAFWTWQL